MLQETIGTEFIDAIRSQLRVSGLTHDFYKYPARFSPEFARVAIKTFTKPGDLVVDPFVGGGTVLVEASSLGRRALGTDISSLATFISRTKITPLSNKQIQEIELWAERLLPRLNLWNVAIKPDQMKWPNYNKAISSRTTWPIRKSLELVIHELENLPDRSQQDFIRCALLRTGQWALDNKREIPSADSFKRRLINNIVVMLESIRDYRTKSTLAFNEVGVHEPILPICIQRSAIGIETEKFFIDQSSPALILTSPPYPGVHVLYHRWQVQGRKETPAPFWIANCKDGRGASFYTFGDRTTHCQGKYYRELEESFSSIVKIADRETIIVQMMGFSNVTDQFPKYLSTLKRVGLDEIFFNGISDSKDNRIWRKIPNRKWYNDLENKNPSQKEVVLFHKLAQ